MQLHMKVRQVPGRVTTGAFILHAGLEKWHGDEDRAAAVHKMATGAFPMLEGLPAPRFLRVLAASEVALGVALLSPFVSGGLAGAGLTGFSGSLLTMYWRTPALRKEGSVWPTQAGTGVSKDVWMLGIGLGLMADGLVGGRRGGSRGSRRRGGSK
jgi:hypothetical protein